MATGTHHAVTTGASKNADELRKRNIHSYENANGGQVVKVEAEDKKKIKKVSLVLPTLVHH